ncbi:hypothetical protein [Daejeonella sp.]|uniref:hypothetical protein n=1 Tax=Daejeonella sp. TaxID=2805397 RepID=UPI0027200455|nr:hypothetical protein [Daejeonella sp.]MDO8991492.1 hypothetical protein [Daejeonella sp.]MDP2413242.1 hypothetical protein [Daejeonella sp.]
MILKLKAFTIIATYGLAITLTSCGSSTNDNSNEQTATSTTFADNNSAPSNIYGIKGEDIVIRKGPGKKYDKIINEKATEAMHKTQYATVDYSCKVREDETKDGWSKIVVVDPDWLSESHQGWIETKHIIKTEEQATENVVPRQAEIFNEVSQVQSKLSGVGIGELKQWRNDSYSWMSSSPYYSFGSASSDNGMQNNLAYYLESKSETYIETVKLVLNINNSSEKTEGLSILDKTAQKTFTVLKLKIPAGLSAAIKSGDNFSKDDTDYKVSLTLDRSKLETWKLTIEAK